MNNKLIYLSLMVTVLITVTCFTQGISGDRYSHSLQKATPGPTATLVNINKISMRVQADGRMGYNPDPDFDWGTIYPRGTAGVVYFDGMLWGGYVRDGNLPTLRVGGQRFLVGTVPGCIIAKGIAENPDDPEARVWRIRPDWETADLKQDAAEFFNISVDSVTQQHINSIRAQYQKDWHEWPWEKGAPFYDFNNNGIMETDEQPGLAYADQVVWFVANDLDSLVTKESFGSPPIGLEMQVTLWAYNRTGSELAEVFQNIIFKRIRLIFKGTTDTPDTAHIDSMFIAQFSETDLGNFADDFAACDSLLHLGYGYNGEDNDVEYSKFNLAPSAFGYTLIQGPMTVSNDPSDYAFFGFRKQPGFNNLQMSSFWQKAVGTAVSIDFWSRDQIHKAIYKVMRGYLPLKDRNAPFYDCYGNPTKFMVSGDPVEGTGCIDGMDHVHPGSPGNRRFQMNSGPFNMALGDTQEVIIVLVGGIGADHLASVAVMKHYVRWAQDWAQTVFKNGFEVISVAESPTEPFPQNFCLYQNYPNPFNSATEIRYDLPLQKNVKLTIYNLLGQPVRILVKKKQQAGSYTYKWDGTDFRGEKVPTGMYLYTIEAGYWTLTKKMMLLQ